MNFKKYMVLELPNRTMHRRYDSIKIRIKNGITSLAMKEDLAHDWTPDPKDKLYFFPGCSVPRFKVRDKFNTTIKPEYATAAFISPLGLKSSDTMFDVMKDAQMIDGELVGEWLEYIYGSSHSFVIKYKSLLLNCENDIVLYPEALRKLYYSCPTDATRHSSIWDWRCNAHGERSMGIVTSLTSQPMQFYSPVVNSALHQMDCPIYSQDAIIKLLNEDNLIIDEKKYQEFRNMANSSDAENIILVMELMANANYKKSFIYLMLLLNEFKDAIVKRKKEIGHVNFKALLSYLDLDEKHIKTINIEDLTTAMKKHKQFTRSNVQRVTQHFAGNGMSSDHFTQGPVLRKSVEEQLDDYGCMEDELEIEDDQFNL